MAPKNKKKQQNDDWEAELGESIATNGNSTPAPEPEAANTPADDNVGGGGGGLMATLRKQKNKKGKNQPTEPQPDLSSKAPEEDTLGDKDDVFAAPKKGGKNTKQAPKVEDSVAGSDDEAGGHLKTKKEKEKEKKEREKQRKKEQAKKKAPVVAAKAAKPAAPVPEAVPEPVRAAPEPAGGKKKKVPAALAAIQRQQELKRQQEEEAARLKAEEEARLAEIERQEAEETKRKEEAKAAKKLKEKQKIEQLKKEGKFLTKAQREEKQRNEMRLKQMLESGSAKVAGFEGATKKKPVYDSRKKKGPKKDAKSEELAVQEATEQLEQLKVDDSASAPEPPTVIEEAQPEKAEEKAEASDELEDWEAQADAMDGVKDSWDAPSDEDSTPKQTNGRTTAKSAVSTSKSAQADSNSDSDSEEESSEDEEVTAAKRAEAARKAKAAEARKQRHEEALAARSVDNLRSPICCILGHVDTGKTKLLDKIRQTNVQEGEAGGITQQIGATYFPVEALKKKTDVVNRDGSFIFNVPGLLVIDTPGHESFTNLRSRGSSLCNIAILVVDIMHGLEPQTLESMRLLRDRKTPFIVALNKIDRLYDWKKVDNNGFQESLSLQKKSVQAEFRDRLERTKVAFAEQGFNSELYYENKSMARNVSLVPTSAHTGEGIPDLIKLLCKLTQERMTNSIMYLSEVECTVLEVKVVEGLGTTIDVILSNGVLKEGDRIVICGTNGPIATNIRALLTPAEMKELRVKSAYVHNKEVKASMGIKIAADGLDQAIAGSRLLVVGKDDDEDELGDEVMSDIANLLSKISTTGRGVSVHASTLGSLEALLEFLRVSKVPVANIGIGPVFKRDVMQAGTMLEKQKEYAVMLCFNVKIDKEAQQYADSVGVKIWTAEIIYHLFDKWTAHMKELSAQRKEESKMLAVFPCVLAPVAVFMKKDPIVVGVDVIEGNLRLNTPICAIKRNPVTKVKDIINLGRVTSIERDHKQIDICKKGQPSVAVKIEGPNQPLYGRHLEEKDTLYSLISRQSIDTLKDFYRDEVSRDEWALIKKLKPEFDIP
ncbi:hypothetical protein M501DRAFT_986489 [Patellaria atrata CBS 101060]|uniref:Eukaryotic translation initiation factor 5B n=1 Tax=Patellaria atrata CBS 101060 TaxID=1346257 RepID=A0A9P4VR38_9PEZI|nr:hypothetical protein M501DRAFT_986489 [Patellaria atrata CBS 101060]